MPYIPAGEPKGPLSIPLPYLEPKPISERFTENKFFTPVGEGGSGL